MSSPLHTPPPPPPPADRLRDIAGLTGAHPGFAGIESAAGPLAWRSRPPGFPGLLRTICGQLISNAAAGAIWSRVATLPGALDPAGLLALDEALLRGAGLSRPKVSHARAVAGACLDGRLDFVALPMLPDDQALAMLVAVPGIGPWTAAVYLLFAEDRADIFPPGDVALAAGAADLFGLAARPDARALAAMARAWSPWRGVAARLLWHWWRHRTGRAAGEAP
ncbi:DNA-3-methyladenine glycosylase family protein [Humitalea sp. 24SJ18S-53]|uniref:DNA-3-methyladenine glycosylase family protein n=1 Tax=Humitalea sp. 24SJ18S-53 TaxID=3422307 RepID=UPI003D66AFE6